MIFRFWNVQFDDREWIEIIIRYLNSWTEIPLTNNDDYDKEDLKFYDGLLGTLLKHTEWLMINAPKDLNKKFVNSWKYQGKLYRVMHSYYVCDSEGYLTGQSVMPEVDYHGMISHWTNDYTFAGLMDKLDPDEQYIILETDTQDHLAFDVNKFRKTYSCRKQFTEKEREFIFPICKENTTEYRMTINEFIQMKRTTEGSL